jgi:hypothetical protein
MLFGPLGARLGLYNIKNVHSRSSSPNLRRLSSATFQRGLWFLIDNTIESRMEKKPKRKSAWFQEPAKVAGAERVVRDSRELMRDPGEVMHLLADGKPIRLPLRNSKRPGTVPILRSLRSKMGLSPSLQPF